MPSAQKLVYESTKIKVAYKLCKKERKKKKRFLYFQKENVHVIEYNLYYCITYKTVKTKKMETTYG